VRVAATDILRARVEPEFARRVEKWAKAHGTDVSETIRLALQRLMEADDVEERVKAALARFEESRKLGLWDPPTGKWKAGGFR